MDKEREEDDDALMDAIFEGDWERSRELMKRTDALRLVQHQSDWGERPLHSACTDDAPIDIVESICTIDPLQVEISHFVDDETTSDKNINSSNIIDTTTPLHLACSYASYEVVTFLLNVAPQATTIADPRGSLPLHCAIDYKRAPSLIKMLLRINPTAVYYCYTAVANDDGDSNNAGPPTPLTLFVNRWKAREPNLRCLVDFDSLDHPADNSHESIEGLAAFSETLLLLLTAYIHGTVDVTAVPTDLRSWFPLHEVIKLRTTITSNFILVIDQAMHMECVQYDEDRNFPLHVACATMRF